MLNAVRGHVLALFLSAVFVSAQLQPPAVSSTAAAPKAELATITGRVVRATDGAPIKKAMVVAFVTQTGQASRARPKSATTDADGNFVLKDLESGRYMLRAKHNGYADQSYGRRTPFGLGTAITLMTGQQLKDIVFRMVPAGVIAGRVVDEEGEPMYHAQVQAQTWLYFGGKRQLVPRGRATTNDLGEYRIAQLEPGRYIVSATTDSEFDDPGDPSADSHQSYLQTFYPGVHDSGQADSLEVKGGTEIGGINLRLVPTHAVTIRGIVTGSKVGANVQVFRKGDSFERRSTFTDSKGTFEIGGILPGSYRVVAAAFGDEKRTFAIQTVDVSDSDVEGINLLLTPGTAIPGRVRIEGNTDSKGSSIVIALRSDDPVAMYAGTCGARVEDDMTFTLKACPDGDYRVHAFSLPPDAYVKSARVGSTDILEEPFHIVGAVKPLEVVISTNGGRVEGTVADDKGSPFTGARVVLVPDEAHRKREELYKSGNTDQYGRYILRGVAPGTYTIYAWESLDGDAYMDPDFLKLYTDAGKSIRVSESSQVTADLKIIPAQPADGN